MKKAKYTLVFVIFTLFGLFFQSCQEYSTFINIPLTLTLKAKYPTNYTTSSACLADNQTYQSIKEQLGDDKDILAAAIWTKYDSTNTMASVSAEIKDGSGNILVTRALSTTRFNISDYKIIPYVILLTPAEKKAINDAIRAGSCFYATLTYAQVTPTNFNFAMDIRIVVGVKYKVN